MNHIYWEGKMAPRDTFCLYLSPVPQQIKMREPCALRPLVTHTALASCGYWPRFCSNRILTSPLINY